MTETRLPATMEQFLLDVAADHSVLARRRQLLGFNGEAHMRDAFLDALASPDMQVHADICEDDPAEVVVRACGTGPDGTAWRDCNILLLEPVWFDDTVSQDLADDIVYYWDRLRTIAGACIRAAA